MLNQRFPSALMPHKHHAAPLRLPQIPRTRYLIDPLAFCMALIGAPLAVAALGFWALLIPVIAVVMGGIPYLVIGTPILLYLLPRYGTEGGRIAATAFATVSIGLLAIVFAMTLSPDNEGLSTYLFFGSFGLIFGPLWGLAFAWIYRKTARDFYTSARL